MIKICFCFPTRKVGKQKTINFKQRILSISLFVYARIPLHMSMTSFMTADKQFIFEGILYSALTLYNNGGASRSKLAESHKRFVQEIEQKNEEKLSRTQQLNTIKVQALRELGYDDINEGNAAEVFEKIAEIQSRKV